MKRTISFILALILLISLAGCSNSMGDYTQFYYCRSKYEYGKDATVIVGESRDISGHTSDLSYLISLYLAGPSSKKLTSPFPKNTKLISCEIESNCMIIELSNLDKRLSDSEFILACACLTLSAMEFTDAETVSITSGETNVLMNRDDLSLFDNITSETAMEASE